MNIAYVCMFRSSKSVANSFIQSSVHDCTRTEPQPGERTRNAGLARISLPKELPVSVAPVSYSALACCIKEHLSLHCISGDIPEIANPKRYTILQDTEWYIGPTMTSSLSFSCTKRYSSGLPPAIRALYRKPANSASRRHRPSNPRPLAGTLAKRSYAAGWRMRTTSQS